MKIGLRVNKGAKEFVRVCDAVFEIGIGGGQIASTITTKEPTMSNHHSNFVLEGREKMDKCEVIGILDAEGCEKENRVYNEGGLCPTLLVGNGRVKALVEDKIKVETVYRIRKLTPKECWRLMGYNDVDFDKALSVNSNTQLYKQAGNAIVKQVLMAIFSQLNIKGVKAWNDMTETEKRDIIKKTTMAGE